MKSKFQNCGMCGVGLLLCLVVFCFLPTPGFSDDKFAAIACTRNCGQWGWSNNCDTQEEAESRAIAECAKGGKKCKSIGWFKNTCGAFASASDGSWGAQWGTEEEEEAKQKALNRCKSEGGKDCTIRFSFCTDW